MADKILAMWESDHLVYDLMEDRDGHVYLFVHPQPILTRALVGLSRLIAWIYPKLVRLSHWFGKIIL